MFSGDEAEEDALKEDEGVVAVDRVSGVLTLVGGVVAAEMVSAESVPADKAGAADSLAVFRDGEAGGEDGCVAVDAGAETVAGSEVIDGDGCNADTECSAGS
jgi:hypothetical protein